MLSKSSSDQSTQAVTDFWHSDIYAIGHNQPSHTIGERAAFFMDRFSADAAFVFWNECLHLVTVNKPNPSGNGDDVGDGGISSIGQTQQDGRKLIPRSTGIIGLQLIARKRFRIRLKTSQRNIDKITKHPRN